MNNYFLKSPYGNINIIEGKHISNIKNIILYVHGFGGHFQYIYDTLDELINKDNFFSMFSLKLFAFEFKGHGKSEGTKFYINDIDEYVNTLAYVINHINIMYKNIDIIICAKSMGCAITLKNLVNNINNIKKVIFIAPMCGIHPDKLPSSFISNILLCISNCFPNYSTPYLNSTKSNDSNITEYNEAVNNSIYTFDNNYMLATSRELYLLNKWIQDNITIIEQLEQNFLIFHGMNDNICSYEITNNIFKNVKNKKIILFPNSGHMLLIPKDNNDITPNLIYTNILRWINE